VIYAANGLLDAARKELGEAVRLDADLAKAEEATVLRAKLGSLPPQSPR